MSESVLPMLSSRSFIVPGLTFRSLIHFEFIFVYGVRNCSSFILLQVVDQFSHFLYRPTLTSIHDYWKNHILTRWTFVGIVMSLLFNMLSRLVIAFLPRSTCLLIS